MGVIQENRVRTKYLTLKNFMDETEIEVQIILLHTYVFVCFLFKIYDFQNVREGHQYKIICYFSATN